ncbi:MAG: 2-hydroxyacid dehydrogenase [bacterium]
MKPILWMESFSEEEEAVKRLSPPENEILFFDSPLQQLNTDELPDRFIATIRTHSTFSKETAAKAECVISRSTGYDHLLEQREKLSDIPVGHLSEYATDAVAEHNLTVSLSLLKHLRRQLNAMTDFSRDNLTGYDLHDRDIGIVGVGNIGEATARLFMNLGHTVTGHDINPRDYLRKMDQFSYCSLEELFQKSDLVILCLPHTETTEGMITASLLRSMPDNSLLVNAGRGEVVSSTDLLKALEEGQLTGLAIDVYNHEDQLARRLSDGSSRKSSDQEVQANLKLIEDERVIATPHNAFNTKGAVETKVKYTLDNIREFRQSGTVKNPVG